MTSSLLEFVSSEEYIVRAIGWRWYFNILDLDAKPPFEYEDLNLVLARK